MALYLNVVLIFGIFVGPVYLQTAAFSNISDTSVSAENNDSVIAKGPCHDYTLIDEEWRHYSKSTTPTSCDNNPNTTPTSCDNNLNATQWYRFKYLGKDAEIPTEVLKFGLCGTDYPLTLTLPNDVVLPPVDSNEEVAASLCIRVAILGHVYCFSNVSVGVKIHSCEGYYVYFLEQSFERCSQAICVKALRETVEHSYLALLDCRKDFQEEPNINISFVSSKEMTAEEKRGIVTAEFFLPSNATSDAEFQEKFYMSLKRDLAAVLSQQQKLRKENEALIFATTQALISGKETQSSSTDQIKQVEFNDTVLYQATTTAEIQPSAEPATNVTSSGFLRVRRNAAENQTDEDAFTADDVYFVEVKPRIKNNRLRVAIFVLMPDNTTVVTQSELKKALKQRNANATDLLLIRAFNGLPDDSEPLSGWELHKPWVIAVVVVLFLCFILIVCVCLTLYLVNQPATEKLFPEYFAAWNPVSDDEITKDEDERKPRKPEHDFIILEKTRL